MSKLRSRYPKLVNLVILAVVPVTFLFGVVACTQQPAELKITDLETDQIIRIDASGAVFDSTDRKIGAIDDREGSFTFLKPQDGTQEIVFKNDRSIQRENDRYTVKIGDGATFDVTSDGSVTLNGKPWAHVFGYSQNNTQKDRFMAAICIFPLIREGPFISLPRDMKNADPDRAMKTRHKIWIPSNEEVYVDDERIATAKSASQLEGKVEEFLKQPANLNQIVYIAAATNADWGTIVSVLNGARKKGVTQIGLVVDGNNRQKKRFLVQIPAAPDPNEDVSRLKPDPLLLAVVLDLDQFRLISAETPYPGVLKQGPSGAGEEVADALAKVFQKRKEQHVYKSGAESRSDLPEEDRIAKSVVIKSSRTCPYMNVIKVIDAVKGAGANPIILQLDDLPN